MAKIGSVIAGLIPSLSFIFTIGLAGLGLWASTPQGVARIQQRGRRRLATAFIVLGFFGLAGDIYNQRSNQQLTKQVQELSTKSDIQKTLNLLTGGNSFPFVTAKSIGKVLYLTVHNEGDFPLYDVEVEITSNDLREKILIEQQSNPKAPKLTSDTGRLYYRLENFAAHDSKQLPSWWMPTMHPARIQFAFKARNGPFTQHMSLADCVRECIASSRLFGPKSEILKEVGDPVDWKAVSIAD